MKFQLEQKKLKDMLRYLTVDGIFPYASLSVKNSKDAHYVRSLQQTTDMAIFRYARFSSENFKSLSKKEESITFDAEMLHKIISRESPETVITIETKDDDATLLVHGALAKTTLNLIDSSVGGLEKIPFKLVDETPTFPKLGNATLENEIEIGLKTFKTIVEYAKVIDTDFFLIEIDKNQHTKITVGDLEARSNKTEFELNIKPVNVKGVVRAVLTKAVKELAKTMSRNVNIKLKTGFPVWFSEKSHKHRFAVLVAPHEETEEEEGE